MIHKLVFRSSYILALQQELDTYQLHSEDLEDLWHRCRHKWMNMQKMTFPCPRSDNFSVRRHEEEKGESYLDLASFLGWKIVSSLSFTGDPQFIYNYSAYYNVNSTRNVVSRLKMLPAHLKIELMFVESSEVMIAQRDAKRDWTMVPKTSRNNMPKLHISWRLDAHIWRRK